MTLSLILRFILDGFVDNRKLMPKVSTCNVQRTTYTNNTLK